MHRTLLILVPTLFLTLVLTLVVSNSAWSARVAMDENLARRLASIMEDAEADQDAALAELAKLYERYRYRPEQQVFVLQERVGLLLQGDRFEPAKRELLALLDDKPPEFAPQLQLALAQVQLMLDDLRGAMTTLERWRGAVEEPAGHGLFLLGYAYVRGERLPEAVRVLEQAVASEPDPLPIWVELLAYTYGRTGRGDEAVALMVSLIERFPGRERWWRQLAALFQSIERLDSGAAAYAVIRELGAMTRNEIRQIAKLFAYLGMPYDGAQWLTAAKQAEGRNLDDLMLTAELWINARELDAAMAVSGGGPGTGRRR